MGWEVAGHVKLVRTLFRMPSCERQAVDWHGAAVGLETDRRAMLRDRERKSVSLNDRPRSEPVRSLGSFTAAWTKCAICRSSLATGSTWKSGSSAANGTGASGLRGRRCVPAPISNGRVHPGGGSAIVGGSVGTRRGDGMMMTSH